MYTGLYDKEAFRERNPTSGLDSIEDLTNYILNMDDGRMYKYSTTNVCRMLGITEDTIFEHLREHLANNYEEKSIYKKFIKFNFTSIHPLSGEGEDRNRFFFWTTTPIFSLPFFNYAWSINENQKSTLFFRNFLYAIDPKTCSVEYWDKNISLNNLLQLKIYEYMESAVRIPRIRKLSKSL